MNILPWFLLGSVLSNVRSEIYYDALGLAVTNNVSMSATNETATVTNVTGTGGTKQSSTVAQETRPNSVTSERPPTTSPLASILFTTTNFVTPNSGTFNPGSPNSASPISSSIIPTATYRSTTSYTTPEPLSNSCEEIGQKEDFVFRTRYYPRQLGSEFNCSLRRGRSVFDVTTSIVTIDHRLSYHDKLEVRGLFNVYSLGYWSNVLTSINLVWPITITFSAGHYSGKGFTVKVERAELPYPCGSRITLHTGKPLIIQNPFPLDTPEIQNCAFLIKSERKFIMRTWRYKLEYGMLFAFPHLPSSSDPVQITEKDPVVPSGRYMKVFYSTYKRTLVKKWFLKFETV